MKKSTEKQREEIYFCETWLCVAFDGDINNFHDCSEFIHAYLYDARQAKLEFKCEMESYIVE